MPWPAYRSRSSHLEAKINGLNIFILPRDQPPPTRSSEIFQRPIFIYEEGVHWSPDHQKTAEQEFSITHATPNPRIRRMNTQSKKPCQRGRNRIITTSVKSPPSAMEGNCITPWLNIMIESNRHALHSASRTSREYLSDLSNHLRARIALNNCFYPPSGASLPLINPDITQISSDFDR